MDLGYGEYIMISSCMKMPYDYTKLKILLQKLNDYDISIGCVDYYKISPLEVTYNDIWEGVEEFSETTYDSSNIKEYVPSSMDILFMKDIKSRLTTSFLDDDSYEINLMFNYSEVVDYCSVNKLNFDGFIESLATDIFEIICPIYGVVGVEQSVVGLQSISNSDYSVPMERTYISKQLYQLNINRLEEFAKSDHAYILKNEGLYIQCINSDSNIKQITELNVQGI